MRKSLFSAVLAGVLMFGFAASAQDSAQDYPSRPLTMIIPFAAGGPTDVLGRVVAQRMSQILGQQVVVENVGGAGGQTGSRRAAEAQPDGYTFVLGTVGTHAQGQTLYRKPQYNALTDFTPVALLAEVPLVLVARKDFPANNLKDFVAYAKANADKMTYASAGAGSATHLGCVVVNMAMNTDITHVPYKGTAPAMQDLQGGRVDYLCDIVTTAKPQVDGGTVKALAILTPQRSPAMPNVPTAQEQGVNDMDAYTWNALFLPKGTPEPIVRKLADAANQAMDTPWVKERLEELGAVVVAPDRRSPEYLSKFVKSEIEKWAAPIKKSGAQLD